jgi:hypothetical protein
VRTATEVVPDVCVVGECDLLQSLPRRLVGVSRAAILLAPKTPAPLPIRKALHTIDILRQRIEETRLLPTAA